MTSSLLRVAGYSRRKAKRNNQLRRQSPAKISRKVDTTLSQVAACMGIAVNDCPYSQPQPNTLSLLVCLLSWCILSFFLGSIYNSQVNPPTYVERVIYKQNTDKIKNLDQQCTAWFFKTNLKQTKARMCGK